MRTHNMFSSRIKKNIDTFWLKRAPYQELWMGLYNVTSRSIMSVCLRCDSAVRRHLSPLSDPAAIITVMINPFMLSRLFYFSFLDESISIIRDVWLVFL